MDEAVKVVAVVVAATLVEADPEVHVVADGMVEISIRTQTFKKNHRK